MSHVHRLTLIGAVVVALAASLLVCVGGAAIADPEGPFTRVDNRPDGSAPARGADSVAVSGNGRFSTFAARIELVGGDPADLDSQVFRYDAATRRTTLVSRLRNGREAEGDSVLPAISDDGRFVTYATTSTRLPGGSADAGNVVYRYDARTGRNRLVTPRTVDGLPSVSAQSVISGNGRYVAVATYGALARRDTNGRSDVYLWDARTGRLRWVSRAADGEAADADSFAASVSNDGHVAFVDDRVDVLNEVEYPPLGELWDPRTGTTTQLSDLTVTDQGPEVSDNARYVTFTTPRPDAAVGSRLLSYDVRTGRVTEIVDAEHPDRDVAGGLMDATGRWVLVTSSRGIFGTPDVVASTFLLDRVTGARRPLSERTDVFAFDLSADGRRVGFFSNAGDLPGAPDDNGAFDAFVWGL